jgi:hypothetical protein
MKKFKDLKDSGIPVLEIRNVYDLISGYLEDYIEIKLFKNIFNRFRSNIYMDSLGNLRNFDTTIIEKISVLYKKTSRKGSRHSQPVSIADPKYAQLIKDVEELVSNFSYKN